MRICFFNPKSEISNPKSDDSITPWIILSGIAVDSDRKTGARQIDKNQLYLRVAASPLVQALG
jgi:hypothetical protein